MKEYRLNGVKIKPWIGVDYETGLIGKKVLAIRRNHYGGERTNSEPEAEITKSVIQDYFDRGLQGHKWNNGYLNLAKSLVDSSEGLADDKIMTDCYSRIAFYNYIQTIKGGPAEEPTDEELEESFEPFKTVLKELQPDVVIFFGAVLYDKLPRDFSKELPELEVDGEPYHRCYYEFDGCKFPCLRAHETSESHESHGRTYDPQMWHKVIEKFLENPMGESKDTIK